MGIEGHNPSGHCLVASKLIDFILVSVDAQLPSAKKQAIDNESNQNSDGGTLSRALSSVSSCLFFIRNNAASNISVNEQLVYFTQA